jgi:hypothetical protein
MSKHKWQIGTKVICVNERYHPSVFEWVDQVPRLGEIYTIKSIRGEGSQDVTGKLGPALVLEELNCPPGIAFLAWHFNPLEEQLTKVSEAEHPELIAARKQI